MAGRRWRPEAHETARGGTGGPFSFGARLSRRVRFRPPLLRQPLRLGDLGGGHLCRKPSSKSPPFRRWQRASQRRSRGLEAGLIAWREPSRSQTTSGPQVFKNSLTCRFGDGRGRSNVRQGGNSSPLFAPGFRTVWLISAPHRTTAQTGRKRSIRRSRSGSLLRLYVVGVCLNRIGTLRTSASG